MMQEEDMRVCVLSLNLPTIETIEQVPKYGKDGKLTEIRPTKLVQHPVVELVEERDIEAFLNYWRA